MTETNATTGPEIWQLDGPVAKAYNLLGIQYKPRPEQMGMACAIEQAIARQKYQSAGLLPIEAGTGTGKTLAYLIPGALHVAKTGGRMLVSTHTIELGRQILERDGLVAQLVAKQQTNADLRIAHMRGLRHFVSPSRARSVGNLLRDDGLPASAWKRYLEIASEVERLGMQAAGMMGAETFPKHAEEIVRGSLIDILVESYGVAPAREEICLFSSSPEAELVIHRLSGALAARAQILITTHAYTVVNLARASLFDAAEDPFCLLVIDEADQWANAASSVSLLTISVQSLRQSVDRFISSGRHNRDREEFAVQAAPVLAAIEELHELAPKAPDSRLPISYNDPALRVLNGIGEQFDKLVSTSVRHRSHTAAAADLIKEYSQEIGRIQRAISNNESNFWMPRWTTSRIQGLPSISVTGRAPGRIMRRLWRHADGASPLARTTVLTSATLATPGFKNDSRWKSIEIATGCDGFPGLVFNDLATVFQPKTFGSMRIRFADPRAPVPWLGDGDLMPADVVAYSTRVIGAAMESSARVSGRTLVLVPSYANTAQIAQYIPEALEHKTGTPLKEVLTLYRSIPGCCLITPAAWVGVNLPGLVQNLVIPRVPYPPRLPDEGFHIARLLSETLIKLSQGIGRGIRSESDDVTVWFADPRMPLPECLIEETGLLRSPHSNISLLAAIPDRFRLTFGIVPGAAAIGVLYTTQPSGTAKLRQPPGPDDNIAMNDGATDRATQRKPTNRHNRLSGNT